MPKFLKFDATPTMTDWQRPDGARIIHDFDEPTVGAVNAALAAERPLLVRGEPGLGKTQLAVAVAERLERAFVGFTVDSRTEHRDLLRQFDAVRRLAFAQLAPHRFAAVPPEVLEAALREEMFVRPGPFRWALNWRGALAAAHRSPDDLARIASQDGAAADPGSASPCWLETPTDQHMNRSRAANGWVMLVDEIDKAESDVPNGLLEVLGSMRFTP